MRLINTRGLHKRTAVARITLASAGLSCLLGTHDMQYCANIYDDEDDDCRLHVQVCCRHNRKSYTWTNKLFKL